MTSITMQTEPDMQVLTLQNQIHEDGNNLRKMKLMAEILTGGTFDDEIGEDATIQDLKKAIGDQENLPTGRLILMLDADGEHYLLDKDKLTVKDHGVQDGSRIYIFFQPLSDVAPTEPSPSALRI